MRDSSKIVILIVLLALIFGAGSYFISKKRITVARDKRQAVFLTNGQIYFGNLGHTNEQFIELRNVFYPQSTDFLRPDVNGKKKVTLQRLGEELHGPEQVIYINRDQVLYYENMRSDSKINEAINKYIEDKNNQSSDQPSASPSPSATPTQ